MPTKESVKPYEPRRDVVIHMDLEEFTRKAVQYGPAHVIGETILSLCLMANDHFAKVRTNGALGRSKEQPVSKKTAEPGTSPEAPPS
jgi:hypothetical protein